MRKPRWARARELTRSRQQRRAVGWVRERVGADYKVIAGGEVGESGNGRLMLDLASIQIRDQAARLLAEKSKAWNEGSKSKPGDVNPYG